MMNKVLYVVSGLADLCILLVIYQFMKKKKGWRFDERQTEAQGLAYKFGFFTFLICAFVFIVLSKLGVTWCEDAMRPAVAVFFSAAVFAVTAIVKDAFDPLQESPRTTILLSYLVVVIDLIIGWQYLVNGNIIADGVLTVNSSYLLCAVLFFIIGTTELIHWLNHRGAGEDGDAE